MKNRLKRNFKRQKSPILSHFSTIPEIAKNHLFARPQPHNNKTKQNQGCQCKKTFPTTKQFANKKSPPEKADQKPEKKTCKIVKQLPNFEINFFLPQKFREKESSCSNTPQEPVHIFVFNAYKSIISFKRWSGRFAPLLFNRWRPASLPYPPPLSRLNGKAVSARLGRGSARFARSPRQLRQSALLKKEKIFGHKKRQPLCRLPSVSTALSVDTPIIKKKCSGRFVDR